MNPWIPWSGGECPVADASEVQLKLRDECEEQGPAGIWDWSHTDDLGDIIAYRIIGADGEGK